MDDELAHEKHQSLRECKLKQQDTITHLLEWLKLKIKNCKQTKFLAKRSEWTKNYDIFIPGNYIAIKMN